MMLLPVLRPVQKSASRLLLAGTNAAVELTDHGAPLEVQAPTAVAAWNGMPSDLPRPMMAQPLTWQGPARWPAVENLLAHGATSGSAPSCSLEHPEAQEEGPESQLQDGQLSTETGAQCMWQFDAHAVFPPGACVWPAILMTSDGCLSTGFPVAGVPHSDVTAQPIQQPAPRNPRIDVQETKQIEASSGAPTSPRSLRTSASRKQRRRLKAAMAADEKKIVADEAQLKGPALPGLVAGPSASQAQLSLPVSPGPLESKEASEPIQLWPPTPESTPACSPREWPSNASNAHAMALGPFCAFPGVWQIEMPNVAVEQSLPLSELQVEEVPDEELQECERMISQLESSAKSEVLERLQKVTWTMSCTAGGTRVVQKALEVADTPQRVALAEQLQGHVKEAFVSPHANHVLQKCIELIPPERLGFLLSEMHGHAVVAARHRYGCRVLERLLEHCPSEQTAPLIEEVLAGAPQLCRHTFGNFVVQHVLEHGTAQQKHHIVEVIQSDLQRLARHRVASHVVRCALKHSAPEDRQQLVQAIRKDPADLADLAHHHCGSFVVREMRRSDVRR